MTGKRISDTPSTEAGARKLASAEIDNVASENAQANAGEIDAAAAKASVHEAIGKLIGDDAERRRGTADKEASGVKPGKPRRPPRS
jgi:uncharacterized protein YjbJ (UPF0337 family)